MTTPITTELPYAHDDSRTVARSFAPTYTFATFGLFLAILTPQLGGLSVKIQALVGLEAAPAQLGLVTSAAFFFALLSQPIAGRLSDRSTSRFGMRRPFILAGVLGAGVCLTVTGVANNIPLVLVAFCGAQIFSNFAQAALTASVADQVPEHRRGFVSGLGGAATPIAILSGAIGLSFLPTDLLRFAVPGAISAVAGTLFVLFLKDRVQTQRPHEKFGLRELAQTFVFNPRTHRDLGWAWLTKALIMFGYSALGGYLTLYVAASFGMRDFGAQLQFNLLATLVSTIFVVAASLIGGRLSDKRGKRRPYVAVGGILVGVGVLVVAVAPIFGLEAGLIVILVGEALLGTGFGLFLAVDVALCIEVLPNKEDTAKDLGVLNIANTLPGTVAPLLAGVVVIPLVNSVIPGTGYSVWFVLAGAVAVVGGALVYRIKGVA